MMVAPMMVAAMTLVAAASAVSSGAAPAALAWDLSIQAYRSMLVAFSGTHAAGVDVPKWANVTRAAREWMIQTDPDCA